MLSIFYVMDQFSWFEFHVKYDHIQLTQTKITIT